MQPFKRGVGSESHSVVRQLSRGNAARKALTTARMSIASCASAPATGREVAKGGEQHADDAERHATDSALEGDRTHSSADVHQLVHAAERAIQDYGSCSL